MWSDSYSLLVPFSAWLSLEERARRLATAELGAMGVTGDVGRLADPGRYSELWFIRMSLSFQLSVKLISPFLFIMQGESVAEPKLPRRTQGDMENSRGVICAMTSHSSVGDFYLHL